MERLTPENNDTLDCEQIASVCKACECRDRRWKVCGVIRGLFVFFCCRALLFSFISFIFLFNECLNKPGIRDISSVGEIMSLAGINQFLPW